MSATILCMGGQTTRPLVLQHAGYHIAIATNERAGLAFCRSTTVQAVILDSTMTVQKDLSQVATEIKRLCPRMAVLLVNDSGTAELPASAFDRVMARFEGPAVLLRSLEQFMKAAAEVSDITTRSACETIRSSTELRERTRDLRQKIQRTRELLRKVARN